MLKHSHEKLLLFLLLSIFVFVNSESKPSRTGKAVINGKIISGNVESIQIILIDSPLNNDSPPCYTATLDKDGNFNIILPVKHLTEGVMIIGKFRSKIAFLPGDKMSMTFKDQIPVYQGKGSEKNNFLYSLKANNLANLTSLADGEADLVFFANIMEKQKQERLAFLTNDPAQNSIETEFKDRFHIDMQVQYEKHHIQRGKSDKRKRKQREHIIIGRKIDS